MENHNDSNLNWDFSVCTAVAKSNVNDLRPLRDKGTVMTNTNIIHIYISKTNTKSRVGTLFS